MNTEERQKLIKEASQLYYSNGTSPLTDAEFDALLEEERKENPNSPLLDVGHGYEIKYGQKIKHKYGIVGSLDKCHDWNEYPKALKNITVCPSLKLDGLSCAMYYKDGKMYQALTRGEGGIAGLDITDKIRKIAPSFFEISDKEFTGAVRGEIIMSLSNFEEYEKTHEEAKNPRNTTAGLIGAKEVSEDLKYVSLVVYTVIGIETTQTYPFPLYPFTDYLSMNSWLKDNFGATNTVATLSKTYENEDRFIHDMASLREIWYGDYPADGIVITDNNISVEGNSINYSATAFKFKAESAETTITGIEWNLSKTKKYIPTVLLEPVKLSGARVSRAGGCHAQMIKENGWGPGAKVRILRSGEVIPHIEETLERADVQLPTRCPVCDSELIWDGVNLACPNPDCKDFHIKDLLIWCENIAPVEGLGDVLKIKFFNKLLPNNVSIESVYDPKNDHLILASRFSSGDQILGAQYRLFAQMLKGLYNNKVSLVSALKALNIPRLGDATAELFSHYKEDILKLMNGEIPDNLAYKIGEANAASILANKDKFKRLNFIKNNLVFEDENSNNSKIKVAITGSLTSMPRNQFEKILNANGFILGDITKDTKYLITNTPDSGSGKNAKADKLGIEKITEAEFRKRFDL